jgi:hypothetical protein
MWAAKNIETDRFQWHAVHTQSRKLIMQLYLYIYWPFLFCEKEDSGIVRAK